MNKLMNKVRKNKKGFTLIELIVVIAILGILVLLAAPRFLGYTKDAKVATMQADAKVLANAALVYNIDNEDDWPVVDGDPEVVKIEEVDVKVKDLEKGELDNYVQTLKNPIADYKIVIENATVNDVELKVGDILHIEGVEGKDGNMYYGVSEDLVNLTIEVQTEADED